MSATSTADLTPVLCDPTLLELRADNMASKGRPYRTVDLDGWEVLVGRSAADNDYLTFRVAGPRDLWMHVGGGTPGSHVVIRNPDGTEIPRDVIERAAQLAAWYSKARRAVRVEVHACRAADVSKPRGAPHGQVEIRRYSRMKVAPSPLDTEDAGD